MSEEKTLLRQIFARLKGKKSLWLTAAALVLGIALMLFGGGDKKAASPGDSGTMYRTVSELEGRVKTLCERVVGVYDVSVMITLDDMGETMYACDVRENQGASGKEAHREYVIASGELVPLGEAAPGIRGIAVVCRGGDDAVIKLRLTEMLCALFDIPSSSVSIMGAKS